MNKAKSLRKLQFLAKQNEDEEERKMKTNQKRNQLKNEINIILKLESNQ